MSRLNSKYFHVIIEKYDKLNDKTILSKDLEDVLKALPGVEEYAFILHNQDKTREHYHVNIVLETSHQVDTVLYSLASDLLINVKCIGIHAINEDTMYSRQRYLIHMDDIDKYQYDVSSVYTNRLDNFYSCLGGINPYVITIELIYELCKKYSSLSQVYNTIGLRKSNTYRNIIRDIWNETLSHTSIK